MSKEIASPVDITSATCYKCQKCFSANSSLFRHLREVHKDFKPVSSKKVSSVSDKDKCMFKCLEGCDVSFRYNRALRCHLIKDHNFKIKDCYRKFFNISDFKKWLNLMEESGASYLRSAIQHDKNKDGKIVNYYTCSRSGKRRVKTTERKRKPKKGGSKKINAGCTSYIKLVENDDHCEVTYCNFHYGHKIELEHIPLKAESRASILDKLEKGAKLLRVDLDTAGLEFEGSIQRSDLLTRADLKNIKVQWKHKKEKLDLCSMIKQESSCIKVKSSDTIYNKSKETEVDRDTNHDLGVVKYEIMDSQSSNSTQYEEMLIDKQLSEENETPLLLEDSDNNQDIKIYYEKDDVLGMTDVEFGIYVANMLRKINPNARMLVKDKIAKILKKYSYNERTD